MANDEEVTLRRLLWLRHGCPSEALYGDDGEMSCNMCFVDFKRWPASGIETHWRLIATDLLRRTGEAR